MTRKVLIAHAEHEENIAESLATGIRDGGYDVAHLGTILVGQSVVEEVSRMLSSGCPVVLCGTVTAIGTGWAHRVVNAARAHEGTRVFIVQMEPKAYVEALTFGDVVAHFW